MKKIFEKIILDQCYSPKFCFFIYICFLWENRLELRAQIHRVTCYTNYLCSAWISLKSVNLDRFYKRFFAKISEFGRLTPDCPNGDICIHMYIYKCVYLSLYPYIYITIREIRGQPPKFWYFGKKSFVKSVKVDGF